MEVDGLFDRLSKPGLATSPSTFRLGGIPLLVCRGSDLDLESPRELHQGGESHGTRQVLIRKIDLLVRLRCVVAPPSCIGANRVLQYPCRFGGVSFRGILFVSGGLVMAWDLRPGWEENTGPISLPWGVLRPEYLLTVGLHIWGEG